jgi:hypothetical protein
MRRDLINFVWVGVLIVLAVTVSSAADAKKESSDTAKLSSVSEFEAIVDSTPSLMFNIATHGQVKWQVVSAGGTRGVSNKTMLSGTIGQTAVGTGNSDSFRAFHGFWQNFNRSFLCGDANGDATVDISDAVYLISYIFSGGPAPAPLDAGDANCDSTVDISDVVYLIAYIFSGGAAPCAGC